MHSIHLTESQVNTLTGVLMMAQQSFEEPYGRSVLTQLHQHLLGAPLFPEEEGIPRGTPGPLGMLQGEVTL